MNKNDYKRIRNKLNLTQQEFADLIGAGMRTVVRWEKGESKPGPKKRQSLSLLLDGVSDRKQLNFLRHTINNAVQDNSLKSVLGTALKGVAALVAIGTIAGLGKYIADYFKDGD